MKWNIKFIAIANRHQTSDNINKNKAVEELCAFFSFSKYSIFFPSSFFSLPFFFAPHDSCGLKIWNCMRSVDFLPFLPYAYSTNLWHETFFLQFISSHHLIPVWNHRYTRSLVWFARLIGFQWKRMFLLSTCCVSRIYWAY